MNLWPNSAKQSRLCPGGIFAVIRDCMFRRSPLNPVHEMLVYVVAF